MTYTITVRRANGAATYKAMTAQDALSRLRRSKHGPLFAIEVLDDATRRALNEDALEDLADNHARPFS